MGSTHIAAAHRAAKFSAAMCYGEGAMAEPSSSAAPEENEDEQKKPKKAKAKWTPAPPQDAGPLTRWSTWSVIGVLALGGVVVWKLWGSNDKGDIHTLCNAEKGSGLTLAKDMPKVVQWLRENLETPEGNTFFSSLTDAKLTERGKKLQSESEAVGLPACPTVAAYERLGAQAEYRADLQHLCSSLTLPKLAEKTTTVASPPSRTGLTSKRGAREPRSSPNRCGRRRPPVARSCSATRPPKWTCSRANSPGRSRCPRCCPRPPGCRSFVCASPRRSTAP